jgi:hypothetical protein
MLNKYKGFTTSSNMDLASTGRTIMHHSLRSKLFCFAHVKFPNPRSHFVQESFCPGSLTSQGFHVVQSQHHLFCLLAIADQFALFAAHVGSLPI